MRLLFLISCLVVYQYAIAQLVTTTSSPLQLVQNVLVGQGVTVSDITYSGAMNSIGRFNAANTSLGVPDGILITTGTISNGPNGPHGPNNRPNAGIDNGSGGYGFLSNIVNKQTYNASVLQFDFVPQSDTIRFEYIFASEEYPEWVGDQFNDVFAFFISGPGIPGGMQNMAIIPGTNQPVTINNVNNGVNNGGPCTNCNYYVNNGTGNIPPFNQSSYYIQYDGFTKPMQAISPVQCGETYRLIIAIADVGDPLFDSGIFLTANSFSSLQHVNVTYELSGNPYGDNKSMSQECSSAQVKVTRTGDLSQPMAVPVVKSGSAVDGVDYSGVPDVVNFNANQSIYFFNIETLNNPGLQTIADLNLDFMFLDPCGFEISSKIELLIHPIFDLSVDIDFEPVVCSGQDVLLSANATGGGGELTYLWSNGADSPTISVNPLATTSYWVSVVDTCLNVTVYDSVVVDVPIYDELILGISDNMEEICPYVPNQLLVEALGGAGAYTYSWSDSQGGSHNNYPVIVVTPNTTTTYTATVTDLCETTSSASVTITVLSPPMQLTMTPDVTVCPNDTVALAVIAEGGYGNYYYYWLHSGETDSNVLVSNNQTTSYTVEVKDDCNTFVRTGTSTVFIQKPTAHFIAVTDPKYIDFPITFQNLTNNGNFYSWDFGDGNFSTATHPNNTYHSPGQYLVELIAMDDLGCLDTTRNTITILDEVFVYVPNAFTPNGDRHNQYFSVSALNLTEFQIVIFNRWGELIFESKDTEFQWDGTFKGKPVPDGTYSWKINYTSINHDNKEITGFVTLLR